MPRSLTVILVLALLLVPAALAAAESPTTEPSPAVTPAVTPPITAAEYAGTRIVGEKFAAAWGRNDAAAMLALFTHDADLVGPWGRIARGKGDIEKLLADEKGGPALGTVFSTPKHTVRFVTRDVAVADLDLLLAVAGSGDGTAVPPLPLHVTNVLVRVGATWLIASSRPIYYDARPAAFVASPAAEPAPVAPSHWEK